MRLIKQIKGIDAKAIISDAIDYGRANAYFSDHPDLSDALAFQPYFGCMIVILWMMITE